MSAFMTTTQRTAKHRGAVFVFVAISLTTLLLFAAVTLAIIQRTMLSRYLASLADASALAGTSVLVTEKGCTLPTGNATCSSQDRWDSSLDFLLRTLQSGEPPGGLFSPGSATFSTLTEITPRAATGAVFTTNESSPVISVSAERGWWRANTDEHGIRSYHFVSLEDPTAYDYPGIPRVFRFNAMKIRIVARPSRIPFLNNLLGSALEISKEAIATVNHDVDVPLAPFAVPLCSLLKQGSTPEASSVYSAYDICMADRLIAPTSRYCPSDDPNCRGVVPQFNWDPNFFTTSGASGDPRQNETVYWSRTDKNSVGAPLGPQKPSSNVVDRFCFWGSPRYSEPEDNFAFAAWRCHEDGTPPVESDVIYSDQGGTKWVGTYSGATVRTGDSLCPIPNGFTTPDSKSALWNTITNSPPSRGSDAPEFPVDENGEELDHAAVNQASSFLITSGLSQESLFNEHRSFQQSSNPGGNCVNLAAPVRTDAQPNRVPRPRWPRDFGRYGQNPTAIPSSIPSLEGGTCNSVRTGWGFWDQFATQGAASWFRRYAPPNYALDPATSSFSEQFGTVPAWKAWVAVVADPRTSAEGAAACAGVAGNSVDPRIEQIPYEIVGFLKLHLYDLDVSDPPPTFPPNQAPFQIGASYGFDAYRSGANLNAYMPSNAAYQFNNPNDYGNYRWWFNRPDQPVAVAANGLPAATPHPCNIVRARLACKQPPMPQTGGTARLVAPRLVVERPQ